MEFRQDINGLRALAVLVVVLFHFGVAPVSGGFAGVDVFFVISGYLMTGIIVSRLEQGRFSLLDFWLARGRRIVPALLVPCVALLGLGWFWMSPLDYQALGKHIVSSLAFVSNVAYLRESGYFDAASQDKWLLHTWSLSVEWQFYMVYPVLLLAAWALGRHRQAIVWTVWAGFLASLAASLAWVDSHPSQAYYLLPFRAWQLLAGGLVFLHAPRLQASAGTRSLLAWAGLAAIAFSCIHYTHDTPWPGVAALLPVGGAALVIAAASRGLWLTDNPVAQSLGKWSYSIYLWHWPVWAGLAYFGVHRQPAWIATGIAASVGLGMLSFVLVERPSARLLQAAPGRGRAGLALATVSAVVLAPAGLAFVRHGFELRLSPAALAIAKEGDNRYAMRARCDFNPDHSGQLPHCVLGNKDDVRLVVWGDSHAAAIVTAVAAAVPYGVAYHGYTSCPSASGVRVPAKGDGCPAFNEAVLAEMKSLPPQVAVLVVNRFSSYLLGSDPDRPQPLPSVVVDGAPGLSTRPELEAALKHRLVDTLCGIRAQREVYVLEPIPEVGVNVPNHLARALMRGEQPQDVGVPLQRYRSRHALVRSWLEDARDTCGVKLMDPTPYLCRDGQCAGSRHLQPLYYDDNHLSERGNRVLVPLFQAGLPGGGLQAAAGAQARAPLAAPAAVN